MNSVEGDFSFRRKKGRKMIESITYEKAEQYSVSLYPRHVDIVSGVARELAEQDHCRPSFSKALQRIIDSYAMERVADAVLAADG